MNPSCRRTRNRHGKRPGSLPLVGKKSATIHDFEFGESCMSGTEKPGLSSSPPELSLFGVEKLIAAESGTRESEKIALFGPLPYHRSF